MFLYFNGKDDTSQSSHSQSSREDFHLCLIQIDCLLPLHISLLAELPIFILGEQKLFKEKEYKSKGLPIATSAYGHYNNSYKLSDYACH